jgi:tetratricopeptide (TPR) repeat protein
MMRLGIVAGLAVVLFATGAQAEPERLIRKKIARGMIVEVRKGNLTVKRGKLRATLPTDWSVESLATVKVKKKKSVEIVYRDTNCGNENELTFTLDHLEARLFNVKGLRLHRKKKYAEAAVELAKAQQLDPDFRKATTNHAGALARRGKKKEAVAALAHWIKKNPVLVYDKVMTDADLESLRDAPEITGLAATKKGRARLNLRGGIGKSDTGYSSDKDIIAIIDDHSTDDLNCEADRQLVLLDRNTGTRLFTVDVGEDVVEGEPDECKFEPSKAGIARANRILADFGFTGSSVEKAKIESLDDFQYKARFKKGRIGFTYGDEVRAMRKDKVLAEGNTGLERLSLVKYVPDAKVIIYWSGEPGGDCAGSDPESIDILALPK